MNTYKERKEDIRNKALWWQEYVSTHKMFYSDLIDGQEFFEKMGKRYGLLKEFRENAII